MRTIQPQTGVGSSRWRTVRRDASLLARIAAMTLYYFTKGRRIRAAYRRCEAQGKTYWVDDPESVE